MTIETILQVLKYLGIATATGSAVWAMLNKLTYEDDGGHRKLTRAGKIAVGALFAGALISVGSNHLQEKMARRSAQTAAERDTQRTKEIIHSTTPLRQLIVKWRFDQVPERLHQRIKAAKAVPDEWSEAYELLDGDEADTARRLLHRQYSVYPWMTALEDGKSWALAPAVLLVALDESAANVLPLGVLSLRRIQAQDAEPKQAEMRAAQLKRVAGTVEFTEDLQGFFKKRPGERTRRCDLDAKLVAEPPVVTVEWNLDPGCIAKGVDRADPSAAPVARLPDRITLRLLTRMDELPFNPGNFTESQAELPWILEIHRPQRAKTDDYRSRSTLELIPNGRPEDRVIYPMEYIGTENLRELRGGGEVIRAYGRLSVWEGKRQ
jgi:hypothetical protein